MKLYNAMEESYLKENLIHKWVTNIVRQNDGYEFLFDDEVYLPVYKKKNCKAKSGRGKSFTDCFNRRSPSG